MLAQVDAVAGEDVTVLLLGESGTGKELVAKILHKDSRRKKKPFVPVNCMALTATLIETELFGHERGSFTGASEQRRGRFEMADGGTIFLDEIGELTQDIQVKLLRVLQERAFERVGGTKTLHVDVRLITATNKDLKREVAEKNFRDDLYYRLNIFSILLPPLRDRGDDVLLIADFCIKECNARMKREIKGLDEEARATILSYHWPGNVRELQNAIEHAFVMERGEEITLASLPPNIAGGEAVISVFRDYPRGFDEAQAEFAKRFVRECLEYHRGNVKAASKELGIPEKDVSCLGGLS